MRRGIEKAIYTLCILLPLFSCGSDNYKVQFSSDQIEAQASSGTVAASEPKVLPARIINGFEHSPANSPQILKLDIKFTDSTDGFCTGTVIGSHSILSAGHCFKNQSGVSFVKVNGGSSQAISQIIIHPLYREDFELGAIFNDVAVLKATEPLNLPALSIFASGQITTGDLIGIYGYGIDEKGNSGILRSGNMLISAVTANHLFAVFNNLSNTCSGDSGGPVTYSSFDQDGNLQSVALVGITSTGTSEKCDKGDLNLFTNINNPHILNFIIELVPEVSLL